jgi:hypothetical protein
MTPDADPNYSTLHLLLKDGCAVDDTVVYHDAPTGLTQRFSFQAFRFNERPTAVVYMHCYIDVCSVRLFQKDIDYGSLNFRPLEFR